MRFPTHFEHSNPFNEAILDSGPKFQLLMIKNKHSYIKAQLERSLAPGENSPGEPQGPVGVEEVPAGTLGVWGRSRFLSVSGKRGFCSLAGCFSGF